MDIMNAFHTIAEAAAEAQRPAEGDFERDGLLYCGVCGQPKQAMIRQPFGTEMKPMPVMCACREKQHEAAERQRRADEIRLYREQVLGRVGAGQTFAADDGAEKYISKVCRGYAAKFSADTADGLMLCGGQGSGKTFFARAILNEVAGKGFTIMFATAGQLERTLWDSSKSAVFEKIERTDLMVLDDLGAERSSSYMQQIVFDVLDCRLDRRKPLIITTNMKAEQLLEASTPEAARIISRVQGAVAAVSLISADRRKKQFILSSEERLAEYYNAGEPLRGAACSRDVRTSPHFFGS